MKLNLNFKDGEEKPFIIGFFGVPLSDQRILYFTIVYGLSIDRSKKSFLTDEIKKL